MAVKKKIVVLTGAGISAESGVATFRDSGGLWEGYDVMDVASPEGWKRNPKMVLDFYNQRRRQLHTVKPNAAHTILVRLEEHFEVRIITQNVDDLHERAGSSNVLHLHGELLKVHAIGNESHIEDWPGDLHLGDRDKLGNQLRPHVVWFGEAVPALDEAIESTMAADIFVVIGTSLLVYPAAGLVDFTGIKIPVYYIDPNPKQIPNLGKRLKVISETASKGMEKLERRLLKNKR